MANFERQVVDLAGIRADGWFEQLSDEVEEMAQLCAVVGARFVAFSFIASVRIVAVRCDESAPDEAEVEFSLGESDVQVLPLPEFRERLGAALLGLPPPDCALDQPDVDDETLRESIGQRYVLLAPLFGVHLATLAYGGGEPPVVTLELAGVREDLGLQNLHEVLDNAVRSEVARARPHEPFSIDFKKIPQAELANRRGEYQTTIALLGAWPGPLSMFLRTPQGQALGPMERERLMQGLGVLGEAYLCTGNGDWAEDVLRLGIQFGQELPASAHLFGVLGRARLRSGRYGEAIGLLRRAIALGGDRKVVLPELARCFIERKRWVAALGCLRQAAELGVERRQTDPLWKRVRQGLGPAYKRFEAVSSAKR